MYQEKTNMKWALHNITGKATIHCLDGVEVVTNVEISETCQGLYVCHNPNDTTS